MTTDDDHGRSIHAANQVRFADALWVSFDRFSRYSAVADAVRRSLGPGRHSVLDVGDASGYLRVFDDELDVVSLDVTRQGEPLPGAVRILGSGAMLPFRAGAFDAVVSSDTLEHVDPQRRPGVIEEVTRVARTLVVVAAPFDTLGVRAAEDLVRRYALLVVGTPQQQLDEHLEHGLPDLDATCSALLSAGLQVDVAGNGNLHDWVSMMFLKHQLMARPDLQPLSDGYDVAYNSLFSARDHLPPHYRHVIVGTRNEKAPRAEPRPAVVPDAMPMLSIFMAANVIELLRGDLEARLDRHDDSLAAIREALGVGLHDLRGLTEIVDRREAEPSSTATWTPRGRAGRFLKRSRARLRRLVRSRHR